MTDSRLIDITIRLTPRAARNKIGEWAVDAEGQRYLKAYVTAIPEDGKANTALIALLSKEWHVPKTQIEIVRGHTDRIKTIRISEDAVRFC